MYMILSPETDPCAPWLAQGLRDAGLDDVELVTAEALAAGNTWMHRVSSEEAWFSVKLPDAREIDSRQIEGVVNRLHAMLPQHIATMTNDERTYGEQEFSAFTLGLLASLPGPVLNPATPQGLCGAFKHPSELVWLASQAGLPTLPYVFDKEPASEPGGSWQSILPFGTPVNTVFVVGDEVVGSVPPGQQRSCLDLAAILGQPMLGIDFLALANGRSAFAGANPCPTLVKGGEALVLAVARALQTKGEDES